MSAHQDRYIPADNNAGWPVAAGIVALAIACIVAVTYIHKKTYLPPTDVTWEANSGGEHK